MQEFSEIALFTQDVDGLADFYEKLLDAAPVYRSKEIAIFAAGQIQLLIHKQYPEEPGEPPNEDHVAVGVNGLDAACAALAAGGISIALEPRRYDWGRSAYLRDPDGRLVELHESGQGPASG